MTVVCGELLGAEGLSGSLDPEALYPVIARFGDLAREVVEELERLEGAGQSCSGALMEGAATSGTLGVLGSKSTRITIATSRATATMAFLRAAALREASPSTGNHLRSA